MFYPNYYPYMNYNFRKNNFSLNNTQNYCNNNEKKDITPPESETIPFQNYTKCDTKENDAFSDNSIPQDRTKKINILGFSLEIDDLIIIGLIILLFLESDKNYALIIILGLILLNVNLNDILNIF